MQGYVKHLSGKAEYYATKKNLLSKKQQQNTLTFNILQSTYMHKKIKAVKKDLDKGEKDVKKLMKADVKMDKKMDKMKKKGC